MSGRIRPKCAVPGLRRRYRPELIDKIELFRDSLISLASRHPHLSIHYIYASRGDASHLSSGVESRASILEKALKTSFADCEVHIEFLGAAELLGRARQHRATNLGLRFIEQPIAPDQDGYIVLVKIADYYRFISESDSLRRYIFESNVREYQGNNEVNSEIARTLKSKDLKPDFWWLNNGVTIIASHASVTGKTLWLENPQIVNGLQTSENVFTYFQGRPSNGNAAADERAVLAKVVVTSEPALRDRIIKATNSQTPLPSWSLRATDPIQRDIEDYFRTVGLYYDRRKNSYRYVEPPVPLERVISIPYLAQAVMAIALARPNDARARPTSIINRDTDYATVFDAARPLETYHVCARLMREVEMYLEGRVQAGELSSHQRDNFRFHFAWMMIVALFGRKGFGIQELTKLSKIHISDHITLADRTLVKMLEVLASFQRTHADWDVARIAKSGDFQRLLNSSFRPRRSSAVVQ